LLVPVVGMTGVLRVDVFLATFLELAFKRELFVVALGRFWLEVTLVGTFVRTMVSLSTGQSVLFSSMVQLESETVVLN
jgi:hypothetical protein